MKTSEQPSVAISPTPPATPSLPPAGGAWSGRALALPGALALILLVSGMLLPRAWGAELAWTFRGAGVALLGWTAALYAARRRAGRAPALEVGLRRHHWVQACAQTAVLLYWGWHVDFVYAFFPLVLAQLVFAYAVDSLLTWSRRDAYSLGFGPFPIVLSINLFLWFRPEWFYLQFAMIAVGYAAKEVFRWKREGRSTHVFNPSSFPLALFAGAMILTGTSSELTVGREIAGSQYSVPLIYLAIFLAALPGQLLFGVARTTLAAVVTLYGISLLFLDATGTYLFLDSHIPVPVFLGMHLLLTDPSTSPRTSSGRLLFGALYGVGVAVSFVVLDLTYAPTYFDKLLPLPFLNLAVRRIDAWTSARPFSLLDRVEERLGLTRGRRHLAYTGLWVGAFAALSAAGGVGDRHPGQFLPFWERACEAGSGRACAYAESKKAAYCVRGSGWACNEFAIALVQQRRTAAPVFRRGCELGYGPACENLDRIAADARGALVRSAPQVRDLPVVLTWKGTIEERDPDALLAMACRQGWRGMCSPP